MKCTRLSGGHVGHIRPIDRFGGGQTGQVVGRRCQHRLVLQQEKRGVSNSFTEKKRKPVCYYLFRRASLLRP